MTHHPSYFQVPAADVRAAGESFLRSAGSEPSGAIPAGDLIHSLRRHGIPVSLKADGARNAPPPDITEAARRLLAMLPTPAQGVPTDIRAVVDWVLACAPGAPASDSDSDSEHHPWHHTQHGVICACGRAMTADEQCPAAPAATERTGTP